MSLSGNNLGKYSIGFINLNDKYNNDTIAFNNNKFLNQNFVI